MFYTFNQNNSGGRFVENERVRRYVIVEAGSADDANERATSIGVYFNGCASDRDCNCCGDRWYPVWEGTEGDEVPSVWEVPVTLTKDVNKANVVVYYKDGSRKYAQHISNWNL